MSLLSSRSVLNKNYLILPLVGFLSYCLGTLIVTNPKILILILSFVFLGILLCNIKLYFCAMLISIYIPQYFFEVLHVFPPGIEKYSRYIDEGFVLFALGYLLLIILKKGKFRKTPIDKYFLGFMIITGLSYIANEAPVLNTINFLFSYIKPIIIFYLIINLNFDEKFYKKIGLSILIIVFIQVFLNLAWFLGLNPLPNPSSYPSPDFAIGSFGWEASRTVALFTSLNIIAALMILHFCRKKSTILLMVLLIANLVLTDSKMTFVILPISIVFLMLILKVKLSKKLIIIFISLFLLFMFVNYLQHGSFPFMEKYSRIQISEQPKIIAYRNMIFDIRKDIPYPLLGAGPGMYASEIALKYETPLALKYIFNPAFYHESKLSDTGIVMKGVGFKRTTGLVAIGGDIGLVGLFFYLMIYYKVYIMALRFARNINNKFWKILSFSSLGGLIFICIFNIFSDVFTLFRITFPVWTILAGIYCKGKNLKKIT